MGDALRVVAHLGSRLAGDAPHLDSLLVYVASRLGGKGTVPGYKVDRRFPCPDTSKVRIPLLRETIAGHLVARCTSPIMSVPRSETVEHVAKRLAVEHAGLLDPSERLVVTTTNGWTKSYRLPLRGRDVERVVWLCVGTRREVLKALRYVPAVGKKISLGYGRVDRWECEILGVPPSRYWPWWIESEAGSVLMRPMPAGWNKLPRGLLGARQDFGACSDPYWHPERYGNILSPC